MDAQLVCNLVKCRKKLTAIAWVTSCSHVFCEEDVSGELASRCVCPACDTPLPGKFDLVRVDLEPTEQYRSMVLAGQRPETIVDVCSRALGFWSYQVAQQLGQQEASLERSRRKIAQLEAALTRQAHDCNSLRQQLEGVLRERWELFRRVADLGEQLMDRQRLQAQRAVDPGLQPAVPRPELYRQHLDTRVPGELDLLFGQTQGGVFSRPAQTDPRTSHM
ncbi:E3 ubiquitin-protein ligase CCNB1IP1-like [Ixodes scapularis]|uniref:E3 ubiquitin-protein ligase CCNB1IP1-like n=1 Tax=Ixodes scapularis TaxID=6945 RepID=UPI001AD633D1|nr:E3 ubiquitin-protein ligase CCNB1IP1-like [Ixodes scapularis]